MRVRVKTLTRRTFGLDVHPSASIDELKARVTQETGIPLAGQRLVYKGEVLHSGCVNDWGIGDDDFLVVIVVRPPAPSPALMSDGAKAKVFAAGEGLDVAPNTGTHGGLSADVGRCVHPSRANNLSNADNVPVQLSELMHALANFQSAPNSSGVELQINPLLSAPSRLRLEEEEGELDDGDDDQEEHAEVEDEDVDEEEDGEEEEEPDEEDDDEEGKDEQDEDEQDEDEQDEENDMLWDHAESLQQLIDMGFPENRARKALQITRGHAQLGMEWLLEHEGDADIDEPLSTADLRRLARQAREEHTEPLDQAAVQRLMEMGFSEEDILEALDHCEHNFEAAASWLLGDRGHGSMDDDGEGAGEAAAMEASSIIHNLMNQTHLQQALSNPHIITVLQDIMEHPERAIHHLDDPAVAPILHALGMGPPRNAGGSDADALDEGAGVE